jgi:hypothetical protein
VNRRIRGLGVPVVVGLLAVVVFVWAHPADRDSSVLNRRWNGLSTAMAEMGASSVLSYDELDEIAQPATLIVIPRLAPERAVIEAIVGFVNDGGTVVVLDDFGHGNALLAALEIDVRFHGSPLLDPLYCHRHASMPRVWFGEGSIGDNAGVMVLNRPTWLETGFGVDVWAESSYFSYGDVNASGSRNPGEPDGPLPVGAVAVHGMGRVVVISDASVLINGMMEVSDNLEAVAQFARGEVLIDQVSLPEVALDRSKGVVDLLGRIVGGGAGIIVLMLLLFGGAVAYAWYNRTRQDNG